MDARDKGYAWVILAAATLILACSISSSVGAIGSLYVELLNYYPGVSKTAVSWLASIQICTLGIVGGMLGPVVKRRGARVVAVTGILVGVCGMVASAFIRNLQVLYFTYGFCSGLANVSAQAASVISVQVYFHRRRALALGIMFAGGISTGYFIGPPLTVLLVREFSLPGSFLLMSGILLQCVWLACLLRPLNTHVKPPHEDNETGKQSHINEAPDEEMFVPGPEVKYKTKVQDTNGESPRETKMAAPCLLRPMESAFGLQPCWNVTYFLFCLSLYLVFLGHMLPPTMLVLRGVMAGQSEVASALLLTTLAAVSMVSRLLIGLVGDHIKEWRGLVCSTAVILSGALTVVSAGGTSYYLLVVYAAGFGMFSSVYTVLQGAVIVDGWGVEVIEWYTGHTFIAIGLATFTMTPLAGMMIDNTDSVTLPFGIFGSLQIVGGIVMYLSVHLQKRRNKHHSCLAKY